MVQKILFIALFIGSAFLAPVFALFLGITYALVFNTPISKTGKILSKYLLQIAVVGLGFGMNIYKSLEAGKQGIIFTIISVTGVLVIGYLLGRLLKISPKLTHLISSGTAICGGSAIAAVAPVVKADEKETSMSLAVIFILNAIALLVFPILGRFLGLSQEQFGLWAAIAIHDTSSVVGAGAAYGEKALEIATTVKLTRALWIIPLSIVSAFLFGNGSKKISIPWFILFFILAMIINTYFSLPQIFTKWATIISHKFLSSSLFLIGSSLSISAIRAVGVKPVILGVLLWILISVVTLIVVL